MRPSLTMVALLLVGSVGSTAALQALGAAADGELVASIALVGSAALAIAATSLLLRMVYLVSRPRARERS